LRFSFEVTSAEPLLAYYQWVKNQIRA